MLGAIIGDIVGSRFEWNNNRSKQFDFLTYKCKIYAYGNTVYTTQYIGNVFFDGYTWVENAIDSNR